MTETQRTTEHEEVDDDELPDDAPEQDYHKESSQRYLKQQWFIINSNYVFLQIFKNQRTGGRGLFSKRTKYWP